MSKHTPGPWVQYDADDKSSIGARLHIHAECQAVKHSANAIAVVFGRDFNYKERDANARLIAAAPAMLEALEELMSARVDLDTEFFKRYVATDWKERDLRIADAKARLNNAETAARAAIKAAKGES